MKSLSTLAIVSLTVLAAGPAAASTPDDDGRRTAPSRALAAALEALGTPSYGVLAASADAGEIEVEASWPEVADSGRAVSQGGAAGIVIDPVTQMMAQTRKSGAHMAMPQAVASRTAGEVDAWDTAGERQVRRTVLPDPHRMMTLQRGAAACLERAGSGGLGDGVAVEIALSYDENGRLGQVRTETGDQQHGRLASCVEMAARRAFASNGGPANGQVLVPLRFVASAEQP